jgi:cytidylate kinase
MSEGSSEANHSEHHNEMTAIKKSIILSIAGLTACGKSTAAIRLAKKYRLEYVSGGTALKELALRAGYKTYPKGWWETPEGMRFLEQRLHDPSFDKQIDSRLLEAAKRGNVVLDSWTMPWLAKKGFKIWLEVSPQERAGRLAQRDGISVEAAARIIKEKDGKTKQIYENLYGFKLGEDYQPFDLILDSENLTSDEVFNTLCLVIDRLVLKRGR